MIHIPPEIGAYILRYLCYDDTLTHSIPLVSRTFYNYYRLLCKEVVVRVHINVVYDSRTINNPCTWVRYPQPFSLMLYIQPDLVTEDKIDPKTMIVPIIRKVFPYTNKYRVWIMIFGNDIMYNKDYAKTYMKFSLISYARLLIHVETLHKLISNSECKTLLTSTSPPVELMLYHNRKSYNYMMWRYRFMNVDDVFRYSPHYFHSHVLIEPPVGCDSERMHTSKLATIMVKGLGNIRYIAITPCTPDDLHDHLVTIFTNTWKMAESGDKYAMQYAMLRVVSPRDFILKGYLHHVYTRPPDIPQSTSQEEDDDSEEDDGSSANDYRRIKWVKDDNYKQFIVPRRWFIDDLHVYCKHNLPESEHYDNQRYIPNKSIIYTNVISGIHSEFYVRYEYMNINNINIRLHETQYAKLHTHVIDMGRRTFVATINHRDRMNIGRKLHSVLGIPLLPMNDDIKCTCQLSTNLYVRHMNRVTIVLSPHFERKYAGTFKLSDIFSSNLTHNIDAMIKIKAHRIYEGHNPIYVAICKIVSMYIRDRVDTNTSM